MFDSIEKVNQPELLPALSLAVVGDTVYDLYFKNRLLAQTNMPCGKLHVAAVHFVKAAAQAKAITALFPSLSEEEQTIYKRGRNAKPQSVPKHADLGDYHKATGFETLVGYLYLTNQYRRIDELLNQTYELLAAEK